MAENQFIVDVNEENFYELIELSNTQLVLFDFWAEWCGPCQSLMPIVTKLAEEYNGLLILAKVNIDEQQALAQQFGVRSVPTLALFKDGKVVESIMGAQSETALREIIDRHAIRESDMMREQAEMLYNEGQKDEALQLIQEAVRLDSSNHAVTVSMIKMLINLGRMDDATEVFNALPADVRESEEGKSIQAAISFAGAAMNASDVEELKQRLADNPKDCEALEQIASLAVIAQDYEGALRYNLEIMKADRTYKEDLGRKNLIDIFNLLGADDPLTKVWRRKMFSLLH